MIERRSTLLAAGAALAAPALLPRLASAQGATPVASGANPGFFRFKVGAFTVSTVHDGAGRRPNPTQGFVRNASAEAIEAGLKEAFLPTDALAIPYTVPFVETPRGIVAFDTGTGAGKLPGNLAAAGIDPTRVVAVVFTHFHGDHVGGLLANGAAMFPNAAEIVVPRAEWAYWMDEGVASRAPEAMKPAFANVRQRFAPYMAKVRQVDSNAEVLPGITGIPTPGHTPGHTSYRLADGGQQAVILGDVTNRPELNLRNPGWHLVFDMDAEMAEATRRKTFDMVAEERLRCVGYHFPFPANGYVAKDGDRYRFQPADWLADA